MTEVMRAATLVGPGQVEVERVPVPELGEAEVLIRTHLAAICGSDLHAIFGSNGPGNYPGPPGYPGHEALGQVIESRTPEYRAGQWVLTVPQGIDAHCWAETQALGVDHLIPLPEGSPDELLMAQQLGTVIYALKRFWPGPGEGTALVVGSGSAGLHFIQLLKQRGFSRVIAADLSAHRLQLARELGADETILVPDQRIVDSVMDLTGGRGVEFAVEAAGHDESRVQVMRSIAKYGRIGFFGLPESREDSTFPFRHLFRKLPTIEFSVGTQYEPGLASFREALELVAAGGIDVRRHVTHRFALEELPRALNVARTREDGAVKVLVTFDQDVRHSQNGA